MDGVDLRTFSEWFDILAVTHSKGFPSEEIRSRAKSEYFDVLRSYPIDAVRIAYENLRRRMKKWPVPADWLENLPPYGSTARLPLLDDEEVRMNDAAEALGYEAAAVCHCNECEAVNCHMPPRYVPKLDWQGHVMERQHPRRVGSAVLLGRWIHGQELRRWYSARAEFYALKAKFDAQLKAQKALTPEERMERMAKAARGVVAETTA